MKKARNFCKLFMWANIGAFVGKALSTYSFYKKHPGIYEMMSAPWYAELLIPLCFTVVVTIVLIAIRVVLKKKDKG